MRIPLLSVKELAAELGVSAATVRRAVWRGAIPSFRIGRVLRFDVDAVLEAMRQYAQARQKVHRRQLAEKVKQRKNNLLVGFIGEQQVRLNNTKIAVRAKREIRVSRM
jgi:excisionase family DNA binding protein